MEPQGFEWRSDIFWLITESCCCLVENKYMGERIKTGRKHYNNPGKRRWRLGVGYSSKVERSMHSPVTLEWRSQSCRTAQLQKGSPRWGSEASKWTQTPSQESLRPCSWEITTNHEKSTGCGARQICTKVLVPLLISFVAVSDFLSNVWFPYLRTGKTFTF